MLKDFLKTWRSWHVVRDVLEFRENLRLEHGLRVPVLPVNQVLFPGGTVWVHVAREAYRPLLEAIAVDGRPIAVCLDRAVNGLAFQDFEPYGVLAHVTEIRGEGEAIAVRLQGDSRIRIIERLRSHGVFYARGHRQNDLSPEWLPELASVASVLKVMLAAESDMNEKDCNLILQDTAKTSYRLAERLPIASSIKLKILELDDPNIRLTIMAQYLKRERLIAEKPTLEV